jgi:hypothetical protein
MIFDARQLAAGWLTVALASGADTERPILNRTLYLEQFADGVRLVATDSVTLLHGWVPDIEHALDPGPGMDEAPIATAIALDAHGRAKGFLAHLLRLAFKAEKEDADKIEVRLRLDVKDTDVAKQGVLSGFEARWVVIEQPDTGNEAERLKMLTVEGKYPTWRNVLGNFRSELTTQVALAPLVIGELAKAGKYHPGARIGWQFGGDNQAARVTIIDSDPHVDGLIMPTKWDLDLNAPRVDDVVAEAERIAGEVTFDEGDEDEDGTP